MTLRHRNSKWMQNNFSRGLVLVRILWVFRSAFLHYQNSKSSLLYIEVWKRRCEIASTPKSRCWSLIFHQWSFAWFGCCPMKNQFEIHSLSKGTSMQARPYSGAVFLSWSVDTKQSSGERGCTIRTKYNVNAFVQIANTRLQTPLKWPLQTPLILCLCFRIQWTAFALIILQFLNLLQIQLRFSFWWNSFW